jgi:ribosomal protein S7
MKTKKTIKIPPIEVGYWDENHVQLTQKWVYSGAENKIIVSKKTLADLVDELIEYQNKDNYAR